MPDLPDKGARFHLAFTADPLSVRAALAGVMAASPLSDTCADDRATVELVLAEVLNNIAEHAYAGAPGTVEVQIARQGGCLACLVCDRGGPMPGGKLPSGQLADPARLSLPDLPEGGFGWSMIRNLTTGLTYQHVGGCNRLGFLIPLRV